MAQDLKELFEKERREKKYVMNSGHEDRFLNRLEEELPQNKKKNQFSWLAVAASVVVLISLGMYYFQPPVNGIDQDPNNSVVDVDTIPKSTVPLSLGDLSPDLKKIEDYYVANINLQLSDLELNEDNKALVNSYMERLAELDAEYARLNIELNEYGPNDHTIGAMIKNLQLRLQLMEKLKTKLNQLKSSKNEQESSYSI